MVMYGTMLWIVRGIILASAIVAIILMLQVKSSQASPMPSLVMSGVIIALLIYHQIVTKKAKAEKDLMSSA